jgi:hypothetical protein
MKKLNFLLVASLMAFSLVACGASKQTSNNSASAQSSDRIAQQKEELELLKLQQEMEMEKLRMEAEMAKLRNEMEIEKAKAEQLKNGVILAGTEVEIPCGDVAYDDENFFKQLGIGEVVGGNEDNAMANAIENAKNRIKQRFGEFVQGVSSTYYSSHQGSKPSAAVQQQTERIMNGVIEKKLNDADIECMKRYVGGKGDPKYYIVLKVSKNDMKKAMVDALSQDEKLKIDFDKAQFQKFMDERFAAMKEAQSQAGY